MGRADRASLRRLGRRARRIALRLDKALGGAEELGVTVALETHDAFASAALVADLLQRVESPSFAALWDLHHPYRVGESPEDVVHGLGSRIRLVHLKDARRRGDDWQLVPLGEGEVPVRESLAALDAAGYDGWLTVEWEKRWHPELAEPEIALPRELEDKATALAKRPHVTGRHHMGRVRRLGRPQPL